jgi:hypothetical protein
MKKLFVLPALMLIFSSASAQFVKFHLGVTSGINSTIELDKGIAKDPRYNSTYSYAVSPIGFSAGVDLSKKFGIGLEGIKSFQQQVYQILDAAEQVKGERKIELSYIQLPLLFKLMSGGDAATRFNFNFGPQLNVLSDAKESMEAQAGTYTIPQGTDFTNIQEEFPTAVNNGDGTYNLPADVPSTDLLTKKADDFKNTQFSIAASFGLDIDIAKHFFLTTQIRSIYTLSEITNGDALEKIKSGTGNSLAAERATVNIGFQFGLHYMFGNTRKFAQR